jgi:hypothetical protein
MDADSKMLSNSSFKNVLKIAGTKPKLLGDEIITAPYLLRRKTMMRKSKAAIISVAAFATVTRRGCPVVQCEPLWDRQRLAVCLSTDCSAKRQNWGTAERPVRLCDGSASPLGSCDTPVSRPLWC